jgi:hypothetical protein
LTVTIQNDSSLGELKRLLGLVSGGRGEAVIMVEPEGTETPIAMLRVGREHGFDQELVHRIERLPGIRAVALTLMGSMAQAA